MRPQSLNWMPSLNVPCVLSDEIELVDLQQVVECLQVRYRRLADADRADQLRFDQSDVVTSAPAPWRMQRPPSSQRCRHRR